MFAHGTTVTIGGTAIGGLVNIGLPEQTKESVDMSDHESGGDMEFVGGLRDGGSIQLEMTVLKPANAGQTALFTNYDADQTSAEFVITLPGTGAPVFTFDGFVTAIGGGAPHNGKATYTSTIKVTGPVVKSAVA